MIEKSDLLCYICQQQKGQRKGINLIEISQKFENKYSTNEIEELLKSLKKADYLQESSGRYTTTKKGIEYLAQQTDEKIHKNNKIFIVHGREKIFALELKDYLKDTYKLDVVIFDDIKKKRTSPTIIELLEDVASNAGYAFIVATPDDLGAFNEDIATCKEELLMEPEKINVKSIQMLLSNFKPRSRQNVVFEHGLFIGALGRDRVCCLLQSGSQEKQTDIDGIVYVQFKENIFETFPEIVEKLKNPKIGLIKP